MSYPRLILEMVDLNTKVGLGMSEQTATGPKRMAVLLLPQEALDLASRIKQMAKRAQRVEARFAAAGDAGMLDVDWKSP